MEGIAKNLINIDITDEMKNSYLDYSMSVIVGRALPDVRDGLKPVHRRILYAMFREGLLSNRRYSKCAGVVGEVLKKYHPHGDSAVYDALVRMAQSWNMSAPLVNGQGNFGSVDGDPAAAYRYTECKMTRVAESLLVDIDKDTVNFGPNFDGSTEEPLVLPAAYPNLLVNGSEGIAVGMATKIPPHNLTEAINAVIGVIDNPDITLDELLEIIPGPDFPTAAQINGRSGIRDAYSTGRGKVRMRGKAHFEEIKGSNDRYAIIVTEIPYQVNKSRLLKEIVRLVKDKKIEGISALRDESDRQGMRIVVELKRDVMKEVVLSKLWKHTALQTTFGVHFLAIVNNKPMTLTLKGILERYLSHRRDVTIRRCRFDLRKANARLHLLEGYLIALSAIDEVIQTIRSSKDGDEARPKLMERFGFSEIQAQAILNMRLQRLTGLEVDKIKAEQAELTALVAHLELLLGSDSELLKQIRKELVEVRDRYITKRRTEIVESTGDISLLDLIEDKEMVITLSLRGYVKRMAVEEFREQRRGGKGMRGLKSRNEDSAQEIFMANTHSELLVFTETGIVYKLPAYKIPESSRNAFGTPIVNLLPNTSERVVSVLKAPEKDEDIDLFFCSKKGQMKRSSFSLYRNIRSNGLIAYKCGEEDSLFKVIKAPKEKQILISTKQGYAMRCEGSEFRPLGRNTIGVRGLKLRENDEIASLIVLSGDEQRKLLTISENGYGKRTPLSEYRVQKRGGLGILDINTGDRNGLAVTVLLVEDDDKIMLLTNKGQLIKIPVRNIRECGRNTKGVRLMRVADDEIIVSVAKVVDNNDEIEGIEGIESEASVETESSKDIPSADASELNTGNAEPTSTEQDN
ncbi:MAG: DNA gyrase subunit A [Myxococcota bacterium]|nr:DNA gyrase subunit A [Myxococcota bacterium]